MWPVSKKAAARLTGSNNQNGEEQHAHTQWARPPVDRSPDMAAAAATALLWRRLAPSMSPVAGMVGSSSSSSNRGLVAAAVTRPFSCLLGRTGAGLRRPIGAPSGVVAAPAVVAAPSGGMPGLLVPAARPGPGAWPAWGGQPGGWLGSLWARWSSTLKKRRSKMNKHKLKKRRKLMRNKNKKNL